MNLDKKRINLIFDLSLLAFVLIILFFIRKNIMSVISPFLYALVIAYLMDPLVSFLERKGIKRVLAILLVFILIAAIITGLFMTFVPKLVKDISVLVSDIPNIFKGIGGFIEDIREGNRTISSIDISSFIDIDKELANLSNVAKNALGLLSSNLIASTGKLLDAIMVPLITFYYLKDKKEFLPIVWGLIPYRFTPVVRPILRDIDGVIGGFIKGQLLVALFVGILTGIACRIIGLPYSITIGLIAGITNVIPYFGPWIGGIMPIILAIITRPVLALWVIVFIVIIQQIESNFLSPQIMSQSVGLHPLLVMFSILLFGNIFGVVGMIIGVPIMGTIKVLIRYINNYRQERNLSDV